MTAGITKEGKHKTWKMNGKPIGKNQVNNIDACKRNESCINTVIRTRVYIVYLIFPYRFTI